MRTTVLVLASITLALLLGSGAALLNAVKPAEATFSGKNGEIAFQSDRGSNYEIYTMTRNGKKIAKLTANPADDEDPAFSPNGKRIAFISDRSGDSDIYTMNADRTKRAKIDRLTSDPADDEDPAFSPDGKKIAFESDRSGSSDIYKMNANGTKLLRLTNDPATTFGADWAGGPGSG